MLFMGMSVLVAAVMLAVAIIPVNRRYALALSATDKASILGCIRQYTIDTVSANGIYLYMWIID